MYMSTPAKPDKPSDGEKGGGEKAGSGEKKSRKVKGVVVIRRGLCKGCGFCIDFCPRHTLVMGSKLNEKGYHYPEVDKDNCTGCDLCGMLCPDFAIYGFRIKNKNGNNSKNGDGK